MLRVRPETTWETVRNYFKNVLSPSESNGFTTVAARLPAKSESNIDSCFRNSTVVEITGFGREEDFRTGGKKLSCYCDVKPLTQNSSFRLNKYLQLFEKHCAFLPLFSPHLDFLQAVKVTKSGHHLLHDRASKGYGSIPGLTSQTFLHACLQRLTTMQISPWRQTRSRTMPLLVRSYNSWWLDFVNLQPIKKSRFILRRDSAFPTDAKVYLSKKKFFALGYVHFKDINSTTEVRYSSQIFNLVM